MHRQAYRFKKARREFEDAFGPASVEQELLKFNPVFLNSAKFREGVNELEETLARTTQKRACNGVLLGNKAGRPKLSNADIMRFCKQQGSLASVIWGEVQINKLQKEAMTEQVALRLGLDELEMTVAYKRVVKTLI